MTRLLRLTLRQKLLGGFLLCAIFTGLAGGAGIFSLNQIQEKMISTTKDITSTIEAQNDKSREISELRALVDQITTADSQENLNVAREKLQQQAQESQADVADQAAQPAETETNAATDDTSLATQDLITHQENYLTASDQLAKLQKSTYAQLDTVTELSEKVVKEIETSAESMIDKALSDVSNNMKKSTQVTEAALANIKTAIMVPSLSNAMNAKVKDAILVKKVEEVQAIQVVIEGLMKTTKTLLSKLPKDDATEALEKLMQKLTGDFDFLVSTKQNQIQLGYSSESMQYENLRMVAQDCNDSLVEMTKLSTKKANSVESTASEEMNYKADFPLKAVPTTSTSGMSDNTSLTILR